MNINNSVNRSHKSTQMLFDDTVSNVTDVPQMCLNRSQTWKRNGEKKQQRKKTVLPGGVLSSSHSQWNMTNSPYTTMAESVLSLSPEALQPMTELPRLPYVSFPSAASALRPVKTGRPARELDDVSLERAHLHRDTGSRTKLQPQHKEMNGCASWLGIGTEKQVELRIKCFN